jgi:hypothetical protein
MHEGLIYQTNYQREHLPRKLNKSRLNKRKLAKRKLKRYLSTRI